MSITAEVSLKLLDAHKIFNDIMTAINDHISKFGKPPTKILIGSLELYSLIARCHEFKGEVNYGSYSIAGIPYEVKYDEGFNLVSNDVSVTAMAHDRMKF